MKMSNIVAGFLRKSLGFALALTVFSATAAIYGQAIFDLEKTGVAGPRSSGESLSALPLPGAAVKSTVAMGGGHTLAVDDDGKLWAWGKNDKGQLGDGTTENRNAPVEIANDGARWVAVAAGLSFSVAIDSEGKLWAWGSNIAGQLGIGTTEDSLAPRQVGGPVSWRAIAAGNYHVLALDDNGVLYTWGDNGAGQLGRVLSSGVVGFPLTFSSTPAQADANGNGPWKAVSAGGAHSLATNTNGFVCSWGANNRGQLGRVTPDVTSSTIAGVSAAGPSGGTVTGIAAGGEFSLVNTGVDGAYRVYAFGDNEDGQLGSSSTPSGGTLAYAVPLSGGTAGFVAAGKRHALAVVSGTVFAWGSDSSGQVPSGGAVEPQQVWSGSIAATGVAAGGQSSLYTLFGGSVATIGRSIEGQHGDGNQQTLYTPTVKPEVGSPASKSYKQVVVGERHTLAIDSADHLWVWGSNSAGQFGDGTTVDSSVPISPDGEAGFWSKIAVSANNSAAITLDGALYVWGSNFYGQFGNSSTTAGVSRVRVSGDWADVALGAGHVLAIKKEGANRTLWAWGQNLNSQVGFEKLDARTTTQSSPKKVSALLNWEKVAAGDNHSLGLAGGKLWGWGQNVLGQVGNGSNLDVTSPTKIGTADWTVIAAAGSTSAGIQAAGRKLFVWGSNDKGQLGDGGTQPTSTPKEFETAGAVEGFSSVALSPTSLAAIAFASDITSPIPNVWVAGSNDGSRLGEAPFFLRVKTPRLLDALVAGSISLGGGAGAAIDKDGRLNVWGSNGYGQLGEFGQDLLAHYAIVGEAPVSGSGTLDDVTGSSPTALGGSSVYQFEVGDALSVFAYPSGTGPFTYQWRRNEVNINGAKSARYDIPSSSGNDGVTFDVVVANPYASGVVSASVRTVLWTAPQITVQPVDANVLGTGPATLSVAAEPLGSSYQWRLNGVPISSQTNSTLSTSVPGTYTVTVSSAKNSAVRSVTSTSAVVAFYPQIVLGPLLNGLSSVNVGTLQAGVAPIEKPLKSGETLTLSVGVTVGSGSPSYQWRRDLQNITTGGTSATLVVPASSNNAGLYDVVVSNPANSVTSSGVSVLVYSKPVFTRQPASQAVVETKSTTLSVSATGYLSPVFQWYGPGGQLLLDKTSSTLVVTNFGFEYLPGEYYVEARNDGGITRSESATLSFPEPVEGLPTILTQPRSVAVVNGTQASLSVGAGFATQFQWRKNGVPIPGATGQTLAFASVGSTDFATYSVLVSNSVGSVLSASANISLRSIVSGDARKLLFDSVFGSNGGLFAARLSGSALPSGTPEGYVRLNFTRAGTASGLYTSGKNVYRFTARFALQGETQTAEIANVGRTDNTLRLTVSGDFSNPVARVQLIPAVPNPAIVAVTLARLGAKNLTLSSAYTGTFQDSTAPGFQGYTSTRVNLNSGIVAVSGMLPQTGRRFTASSSMYMVTADDSAPALSTASLTDLIVRLDAETRLFATWKLDTDTLAGDAVVVVGAVTGTKYDVTGAKYAAAASGAVLAPFVSVRDEAIVTYLDAEVARFTAQGGRLVPAISSYASSGGRFSLRFVSSTGVVSGLVSLSGESVPVPFTGVILQGDYRTNGGVLGVALIPAIGLTPSKTLRFEPAN